MINKGFTFIELLIAIIFFSISVLALFFMFGSTNRQVFTAQKDLIAYSIARERLSWLEALNFKDIIDLNSHDLFNPKILKDGYYYYTINQNEFDVNIKTVKFKYPKKYDGFNIECKYEYTGDFIEITAKVSYKLMQNEKDTREIVLKRCIHR